jgi:hypothetical protein
MGLFMVRITNLKLSETSDLTLHQKIPYCHHSLLLKVYKTSAKQPVLAMKFTR